MQTRLHLLQDWTHHLQALLPGLRVTRVRGLALLSLGLIWAGTPQLGHIAATLPLPVQELSTVRRLRRWLATRAVPVVATWQPLARAFLAHRGQRELLLVFDPTPERDDATLLVLGLVVHRRVLPLAWHIVPGQTAWAHPTTAYLARLGQRVAAVLPPGVTVTRVVDRGLASAAVIDWCQRLGWHWLMRLNVDARQGVHVRLPDGTVCPAWACVPGPGRRWAGPVAAFQTQGWYAAELTIIWPVRSREPWVLLSDRPAGPARVREYRRRQQVEAVSQDGTTRGWNLEASTRTARNRLNRLLLALFLALWWSHLRGQQVVRRGERRRFDRTDRRECSLVRLGRRWMTWLLDHQRLPPLPFRYHHQQWTCRWRY